MKYITLIIGLLVVGCGKENPPVVAEKIKSAKAPAKELTKEDIAGKYDLLGLAKREFLQNGKFEDFSQGGRKVGEGTWKLVEKEVHTFGESGDGIVLKIESNGDLTIIADFRGGKQIARSKDLQTTYKKIK